MTIFLLISIGSGGTSSCKIEFINYQGYRMGQSYAGFRAGKVLVLSV